MIRHWWACGGILRRLSIWRTFWSSRGQILSKLLLFERVSFLILTIQHCSHLCLRLSVFQLLQPRYLAFRNRSLQKWGLQVLSGHAHFQLSLRMWQHLKGSQHTRHSQYTLELIKGMSFGWPFLDHGQIVGRVSLFWQNKKGLSLTVHFYFLRLSKGEFYSLQQSLGLQI